MADYTRTQPEGVPSEMTSRYFQGDYAANYYMPGNVIVEAHHNDLHAGNRYTCSYLRPHGGELANDASQSFLAIPSVATASHMVSQISVAGNCEFELYRGPLLVTNNGTALGLYDKNQTVPLAAENPLMAIYRDPTYFHSGPNLMMHIFVPGLVGAGLSEWILNPGAVYLYRITNRSGGAIQFSIIWEWSVE